MADRDPDIIDGGEDSSSDESEESVEKPKKKKLRDVSSKAFNAGDKTVGTGKRRKNHLTAKDLRDHVHQIRVSKNMSKSGYMHISKEAVQYFQEHFQKQVSRGKGIAIVNAVASVSYLS